MGKTFIHYNHQEKGAILARTLVIDGWTQVNKDDPADICLVDCDVPEPRTSQMRKLAERGTKIFIYPHAARPPIYYDFEGCTENDFVTAQFVTTPRHEEILRRIGYKGPVHPIGWMLCPQKPFVQTDQVRNLLYAPIHANGNRWLSDFDKNINQQVFKNIMHLAERWELKVTVRHIEKLDAVGLEYVPGVNYVVGRPNQSYLDIDKADLVISTQTFLYLAVARGKAALGMGETTVPRLGWNEEGLLWAKSWQNYKELMAYPLDAMNAPLHYEAVEALAGSQRLREWRIRLVGSQFEPVTFLKALYSYL